MGKVLGYGRISTSIGQDVASQKAALEKLGAVVVFTEIGNGSKLEGRDQLEAAIRLLEPGDQLLALHPDRLARDTGDLLTIAKRVVAKGAILKIYDPQIVFDGSDIMGEVMLTIFGMVGMVEKHFTLDRTMKGTDHAFSLEPVGMRKLVRDLKRARVAMGDGVKKQYPSEEKPLFKRARSSRSKITPTRTAGRLARSRISMNKVKAEDEAEVEDEEVESEFEPDDDEPLMNRRASVSTADSLASASASPARKPAPTRRR